MIDTVELTWGSAIGTAPRRARGVRTKTGYDRHGKPTLRAVAQASVMEPTSPPIHLEWRDLVDRLGSKDGEVQHRLYGENGEGEVKGFGHWQVGDVGFLYRDGRLQLRASLPKIATGSNDALLDEAGVHDALRKLTKLGSEIAGVDLRLEEAVPSRIDYVYGWEVASVAFVLEHMRASFSPGRAKLRTENVSPTFGGRSLVYGYGSKHVLRWYDKGAECAEKAYRAGERELTGMTRAQLDALPSKQRLHVVRTARRQAREQARRHGNALGYDLDVKLRFEVQDRRRAKLRLVHEQGYSAAAVRHYLTSTLQGMAAIACRDIDALIASYGENRYAFPLAMCALHLAEHDELWPVAERHLSRASVWRWKQRAREASLAVGDWRPIIPDDAFASSTSLWQRAAA